MTSGAVRTGAQGTRPIHDAGDDNDDIQEVATRHLLRSEVVDLHVGFLLPAAILYKSEPFAIRRNRRSANIVTAGELRDHRRRGALEHMLQQ